MNDIQTTRKTNFRWVICAMLFFATTVNYLDRQALSLTWKDFIAPEFHWTNTDYGNIAAAFSIMYAIANFFSGRIIDWLGTRRGYLWAIGVWSAGACLHALCGWATEQWVGLDDAAQLVGAAGDVAATVSMVSVWFFLAARVVLAAGESGNFPAAVKVTAEYFPKKDRAFATAIFNAGATIGALVAPLCIPTLARYFKDMGVGNGWEMAFVVIGMLGFVWMGIWIFIYQPMQTNKRVNAAEREYILQDSHDDAAADADSGRKLSILECLRLRQTWAILMGKFLTDGVWWFFLFWTPAYISDVYGYTSDSTMAQMLMFTLYAITMLSLYGGKLPTIFINRTGGNAYNCRMKAPSGAGSPSASSVSWAPPTSHGRPTSSPWAATSSPRRLWPPSPASTVWQADSARSSSTSSLAVCSTMSRLHRPSSAVSRARRLATSSSSATALWPTSPVGSS